MELLIITELLKKRKTISHNIESSHQFAKESFQRYCFSCVAHKTSYEQSWSKISLNHLKLESLQIGYHKYETNYTIQSSVKAEQLLYRDVTHEPQNLMGKTSVNRPEYKAVHSIVPTHRNRKGSAVPHGVQCWATSVYSAAQVTYIENYTEYRKAPQIREVPEVPAARQKESQSLHVNTRGSLPLLHF